MSLLPSGYKRLLYIESTGTQYIDTGVIPKSGTKANVAFRATATPTATWWILSAVTSGTVLWRAGVNSSAFRTDGGFTYSGAQTPLDYAVATGTCTVNMSIPLYLCAQNEGGPVEFGKFKVYSCRISNGDIPVRNFIPCINDAGEIGLYETVNGVFCGNSGTGVFIAGPEFWYDELEYIESTGTQYIDTNFRPNNNTRAVLDFQFADTSAMTWLFGAQPGWANAMFDFAMYDGGTQVHDGYGTSSKTISGLENCARYILDKNKNLTTINGTTYTQDANTFQSPITALLFGYNTNSGPGYYSKVKLYSCQFYDSGTLVRDFIPAKLPDGSIGLIDKLTEEFYPNMGTGVFTAGKLKPTKYMELEYIESTGTQYINTGFIPDQDTRVVMDIDTTNAQGQSFPSLFSTDSSGSYKQRFTTIIYMEQAGFHDHYGATSINSSNIGVYGRLRVDKNKNVTYLNGNAVSNFDYTAFKGTVPLVLLASLDQGVYQYQIKAKLYSCEVYDNGTLLFDFAPIKLYDGTVGLLDKLSGLFYGNAGTGDFVAGPEITKPSAPTDFVASVDGNSVVLSWVGGNNATGYYIYRNGELIATTEATLFTDSIVPSISTEYSVSAFNDFGESARVSITIAPSAAPPAPANLRVMFADFASAQIAWGASVGAIAYRVYRDGEFLTETKSRMFADSGLNKDTEYVYTVTAVNVIGESTASSLTVKTSDFTLITDRTAADVEYALAQALNPDRNNTEWLKGLKGTYNATDLNRVEKAVEYVANRLEIAGWRRSPVVRIDWSFSDFPTVSEMQRYLDNIRLLRAALPDGMPAVPADMNGFTYIEANTIEQILLMLDAAVTNIMKNVFYSNEIFSGEVQ